MRKNALYVTGVTGGKYMSKTVGFSIDIEFVTNDTNSVDACAHELEGMIEDKIYDMFEVLGLPYIRVESDVFDNEEDELDIRVEYKEGS